MKVYIVTDGEYSDYHIKRVFIDGEKAGRYLETSCGRIEEFNTSDDVDIEHITYTHVFYKWHKDEDCFDLYVRRTNSLDEVRGDIEYIYYTDQKGGKCPYTRNINSPYRSISLRRIIAHDYDKERLKKKYLKVCHDMRKQIRYLREGLGYSPEQIREVLDNGLNSHTNRMDVDEVCDATDSGDWVGVAMAAAVMWLWYVTLVGMFVSVWRSREGSK